MPFSTRTLEINFHSALFIKILDVVSGKDYLVEKYTSPLLLKVHVSAPISSHPQFLKIVSGCVML